MESMLQVKKNLCSINIQQLSHGCMRDISEKHKDLIKPELETWNISSKRIEQTDKLASKFSNLRRHK